jgi:hypothetical protein
MANWCLGVTCFGQKDQGFTGASYHLQYHAKGYPYLTLPEGNRVDRAA